MQALWVAACPDEAHKFFDFMSAAAATQLRRGADLQIMFGIGGERDLTERSCRTCRAGATARRCGSATGRGTSASSTSTANCSTPCTASPSSSTDLSPTTKRFLVDLADTAAARWREKDQGIWEIRGEPRDFLYSKLMCWVALDRAIALADRLDAIDRVDRMGTRTARRSPTAILTQGWSDEAGAYTQSFGTDDLDASNLMMAIVGFLPATDPRMRATIDAIADRLTDDHGLVYRYLADDGLGGEEGTFLLCTFWLAHALALRGRASIARPRCSSARVAFANDVGLLAEEVDADHRRAARQLPAGVQPHRPRERGVGDQPGAGVAVARPAVRSSGPRRDRRACPSTSTDPARCQPGRRRAAGARAAR